MKKLNLINILYIFFRLAPFVLVCFFVIDSVINSNVRGLVLLSGLLVACFVATLIGSSVGSYLTIDETATEAVATVDDKKTGSETTVGKTGVVGGIGPSMQHKYNCNILTLGDDGPISPLPLSQTTLGYIIAYLTAILIHLQIAFSNIHVILLLTMLIVADLSWNAMNNCVSSIASLLALMVGILIGTLVSTVIISNGYKELYYIAGVSDNVSCSVPTKSKFKCTPN